MSKSRFFSGTALSTFAALSLVAVTATPAFAQETPEEKAKNPPESLQTEPEIESGKKATVSATGASTTSPTTGSSTIVITGSRIKRPNLESAVPITSVGGQEFFETGRTSIGDTLNELPQMASTFSQSNSTRFLGTAGLNLLDLRGLGTARTLVLVNGRRHVGGDALGAGPSVDINTIPADLIDRVDVVTGGSSAVYGSDAIAGVVNFILKRDYSGFEVRGQAGVTKYHDLGNQFLSTTWGRNFNDGRGNIAVNFEYSHQGDAYASNRPNLAVNSAFVTVDSDTGVAGNTDGVPDNIWVRDRRFPIFNNGGDFYGADAINWFTACCTNNNLSSYLFTPSGTLIPQTGTFVTPNGLGGFSTILTGGNGNNGREGTQLILSPILDRYSVNLLAHYTVSDAFEPFIEAKFTRTDSRGSTSAPFFTGGLGYFGGIVTGSPREIWLTTNPFLNPQAANLIRQTMGDVHADLNGDHYLGGAAEYYNSNGVPDSDEFGFNFSRTVTDFGNRDEVARRDTYRVVLGTRGTFNDDWNYEISANYGKFNMHTNITGNVNLQRYLLAIDAVRDPAGNIVCRATIDPAARLPYDFPTAGFEDYAASQLANDVAQCVPVNLFGEGNVSQAAKDYILQDVRNTGRASQFDLTAFMSGDTSQFLNLPGGPIGFVLGAEYRAEKMSYQQDPLIRSGLTFYNGIGTFTAPANVVKEAFTEVRIPILKDLPFVRELTVTGAARVSDYKLGRTGTVWAYNAEAEWSPIRDIRFRGAYGRSVRAPNLGELFFPLSQNFAPGFQVPCALSRRNSGSSNRAANCLAAGVPANFNFQYSSSLQFLSGGNINLEAEKSDSITLGGVLQPRFLPGFSMSADYFNIKVKNSINSPTVQQLVNACYDLPSINNQFCAAFQRNPGPTNGPRQEIPGRILEGSLQLTPLNYAALQVRGIDFDVAYRKRIGGIGLLDSKLTFTHYFQQDQHIDPTNPARVDRFLSELGSPQNSFLFNASLKTGPVTVGYKLNYLDHMLTFRYEDFFAEQGRPPENPDVSNVKWYHSRWYHNARVGIDVGPKYNFYLGVDNLTNALPPLGLTGVGGGSGIYDNRGRFYYAGFVARM
jgi:outer membrane receptor protein involved in Fe transport